MKKKLAVSLVGAMALSSALVTPGSVMAEEQSISDQVIAERKAAAEESGEYDTINLAFFTWTGTPAGLDRINERISERTRETLGLNVELMILDSASYADNMKLMLSSGEKVDIFSSLGPGYTTCVNNEYVYDLEEDDLIQNYGQGILEAIRSDYLDACRVSGTLYGVPPLKDYATTTGAICIGEEYLDGIGYDYAAADPEGKGYIEGDWDLIEDLFAQLHEKYPDIYVYSWQDNWLNQGSVVDAVGGDYYGALMDPINSLTLENVYETDLFKEWCERVYSWNQAGYISPDALTDDIGASARIKAGSCMAMMACSKPGYKTQISGECGRSMAVFEVGETWMGSSSVSAFPWCINQNVDDPAAAMQVMNAFYSDPVLADYLCWGEEGVEYVVTEDGHITWAEGVDSTNSEYYPNVLWMLPNYFIAHVWEGDPLDLAQQTIDFNDNAIKSKALGFTWDSTDYASELTALANAYKEYAPQLVGGFIDPEEGMAILNENLKSAGLDEYMAAKQEALDAWAAENGIE